MTKAKKERSFTITIKESDMRKLLESHSKTRQAMQGMWECGDMFVSDIHNIDSYLYRLE